jgi:hypothetical protein
MNSSPRRNKNIIFFITVVLFYINQNVVFSGELREWSALTIDNDLFVGNDSGYTSGIYYTYFEGSDEAGFEPAWLTRPLQWAYDNQSLIYQYNVTTFGQVMVTPSDITIETPQLNDVPYSGLLFIQQSNMKVYSNYSDKVSAVIGVLGPYSKAEQSQKVIHELFDSDMPQGWDYQLEDELVFQVSRGRVWRGWYSSENNTDILYGADAKLGTLESSLTAGMMIRYGRNIEKTYSTVILSNDRSSNPINIDSGWYVYASMSVAYIANIIYLDGNTFKDSPSVDYDPLQVDLHVGFAYAWKNFSVAVVRNNLNWVHNDDRYSDIREYGSITFLWRM